MLSASLRHHNPLAGLALLGVFLAVAAAEIIAYRRQGRAYNWREARLSLGVATLQRIATGLSLLALVPLYTWLFAHRLVTFPLTGVAGFIAALLIVEFAYYWMHRASHRISWMWATHSVHHSAEQLNFLAAVRLGATGFISFEWLPFAVVIGVLGISPVTVSGLLALDLAYQFFLHSDLLPRMDTRQWLFNTPSDHRVHHAVNAAYIDRNFGGMLIVFDRLFGTYVAEHGEERPRYGVAGEHPRRNAFAVLAAGWVTLFERVRAVHGVVPRLRVVFGPPSLG
jgi:sterol desaturase/sphingolipid hydroxylase (fatty acid hydroxylase superfamily)